MTATNNLPSQLYRAEQVRTLDHRAIHDFQIPGITLMRRAGQAAFDALLARWPETKSISVWCGGGNNGGDGYVIAGLAISRGLAVQLVQVGAENKLTGDAALACQWAREAGVAFTSYQNDLSITGDIVVDALLGTGLSGDVRGDFSTAIQCINAEGKPVLAVDIPSGLCSDTGQVLGDVINAFMTVTFIGVKQGLLTGQGPVHSGDVIYDDLAVPSETFTNIAPAANRLGVEGLVYYFPPRKADAHKGNFGHVLIIGGNAGMGGAAIMAAQAAGRVGAGLVSLATQPEHVSAVLTRSPEIMVKGVVSGQDLEPLLLNKDVVVIGPGLGQSAWSEQVLRVVLASELPLVVDADALNLISDGKMNHCHRDNWVITPHPGEASRLLKTTTAKVQADRFASVKALSDVYGGVALLKGVGTLVADAAGKVTLCSGGNPGMASGGMGDVLSGILGGLMAQGFEPAAAASVGAVLHAAAADRAAQAGERGLLATDLLPHLRRLVNPAQHQSEDR